MAFLKKIWNWIVSLFHKLEVDAGLAQPWPSSDPGSSCGSSSSSTPR